VSAPTRFWLGAAGAVAAYLAFTFAHAWGPWTALAGSLLISLFMRAACPRAWRDWLGLRVDRRALVWSGLLFALCLAGAWALIARISAASGLEFIPYASRPHLSPYYLHTLGQTLNEELVLGALLLFALRRVLRLPPLWIAVGAGALFSLLHLAFYGGFLQWIGHANGGMISGNALLALFAAGVARNALILGAGHVGYAWALHLGWNAVFLGGAFVRSADPTPFSEPDRFNTFLGAPLAVGASLTLMATALVWYRLSRSARSPLKTRAHEPTMA